LELADVLAIIEDEAIISKPRQGLVGVTGVTTATATTHDEAVDGFLVGTGPGRHPAGRRFLRHRCRQGHPRFDVPVIFITAFPERLLTEASGQSPFLITKPFSRKR
jgi:CheY-like chemotaxis protein